MHTDLLPFSPRKKQHLQTIYFRNSDLLLGSVLSMDQWWGPLGSTGQHEAGRSEFPQTASSTAIVCSQPQGATKPSDPQFSCGQREDLRSAFFAFPRFCLKRPDMQNVRDKSPWTGKSCFGNRAFVEPSPFIRLRNAFKNSVSEAQNLSRLKPHY